MKRLAIATCAMLFAGMTASYGLAQNSGSATSSAAPTNAKISRTSLEAPRKGDIPGLAVKVGSQPYGVAFDGKNIWTANFGDEPGSVTKIRSIDGQVLGTYRVGHQPLGVTFDGENIWVSDNFDNTVTKLRASDGEVLGNFSVKSPWWMTSDGESIWVPSYGEKGTVTKLRASDGKNLGTFPTGGTGGAMATAFDGANVWVTNFSGAGSGTVSKLRASDGALLGVYPVGSNPLGVTFDGTYVWVANIGGASISKLQPSDGKVLGTFTVPPEPYTVVSDGKHIWVTGALELTDLQASDGAVVAKYPIENTTGIAFDGKNVWIAETFHNLLHRM